jgi:hypothetical protein
LGDAAFAAALACFAPSLFHVSALTGACRYRAEYFSNALVDVGELLCFPRSGPSRIPAVAISILTPIARAFPKLGCVIFEGHAASPSVR